MTSIHDLALASIQTARGAPPSPLLVGSGERKGHAVRGVTHVSLCVVYPQENELLRIG